MPKTKKTTAHAHLRSGRWIDEPKRFAIYLRDGLKCAYCRSDLSACLGTIGCALDHVSPNGGNHESNLVTTCKPCNDGKGGLEATSFCNKETLARIRTQTALPLDKTAGKLLWQKTKSAKSAAMPQMPTLNAHQAADLVCMSRMEFIGHVDSGAIERADLGEYSIPSLVRGALQIARSVGSGDVEQISASEAQRQLTIARKDQVLLEMEVTRKERIPIDVIESNNERVFTNVAGLFKAHKGKFLDDALISDIFTELRELGSVLKRR